MTRLSQNEIYPTAAKPLFDLRPQRRALELIGRARLRGCLQSRMAIDMNMSTGNFHYVIKVRGKRQVSFRSDSGQSHASVYGFLYGFPGESRNTTEHACTRLW